MQSEPFNPHVHRSQWTPYPHCDYDAPAGKIHLNLDEAEFLAQKRGMHLRPTQSVLPSELNDLLGRK